MKLLMNVVCELKDSTTDEPIFLNGVEVDYNNFIDIIDFYAKKENKYLSVNNVYFNITDDRLSLADWEIMIELKVDGTENPYLYERVDRSEVSAILRDYNLRTQKYKEYKISKLNIVL